MRREFISRSHFEVGGLRCNSNIIVGLGIDVKGLLGSTLIRISNVELANSWLVRKGSGLCFSLRCRLNWFVLATTRSGNPS